MEPMHDLHYWFNRVQEDSRKLSDDKKYQLTKSLLIYTVPLKPDEADIFLSTTPSARELDDAIRYSGIEKKIADAYSRSGENYPKRRESFLRDFRSVLDGFYTQEELDEIMSYMVDERNDGFVVVQLVGANHPTFRKIRNAYLPAITDLIEIDIVSGRGRDVTRTLFDGKEDAVSQIEKLVSGKENLDS